MEQKQDTESKKQVGKASLEERWAVNGNDHGVIGDTDYSEDQKDHDGAETTQGCTALEHIPRHCWSQPLHASDNMRGIEIKSTCELSLCI